MTVWQPRDVNERVERDRREQILAAALDVFTSYGFAKASVTDIAEAAGISRPGLYLHFDNKEAIYRAMLESILTGARTAAASALEEPGTVESQLDGYLQRGFGDPAVWALSTKHGADLIEAKAGHAKPIAADNAKRVRRDIAKYLESVSPARTDRAAITAWSDLLVLSPIGFRHDNPTIAIYRKRLNRLAQTVAKDITT